MARRVWTKTRRTRHLRMLRHSHPTRMNYIVLWSLHLLSRSKNFRIIVTFRQLVSMESKTTVNSLTSTVLCPMIFLYLFKSRHSRSLRHSRRLASLWGANHRILSSKWSQLRTLTVKDIYLLCSVRLITVTKLSVSARTLWTTYVSTHLRSHSCAPTRDALLRLPRRLTCLSIFKFIRV